MDDTRASKSLSQRLRVTTNPRESSRNSSSSYRGDLKRQRRDRPRNDGPSRSNFIRLFPVRLASVRDVR